MKDANGIEMTTGMIVEIKNAYFANDNGLYFIAHTPGDPTWSGDDHSLRKICKNGCLSRAKGTTSFWPLCAFVSSAEKRYAARKWNAEHAVIEVREDVSTEFVREFFIEKASCMDERIGWDRRIGHSEKVIADEEKMRDFYQAVADRL